MAPCRDPSTSLRLRRASKFTRCKRQACLFQRPEKTRRWLKQMHLQAILALKIQAILRACAQRARGPSFGRKPNSQGAAKGVRQKEFDHFFRFRDAFGHFSVIFFLMLLSLFSSPFLTNLLLPDSFCGKVKFNSASPKEGFCKRGVLLP